MNDNAKKWVAALRGGKFKQTKGRLADNGGHCCMGVACEVAIRWGVPLAVTRDSCGVVSFNRCSGLLPKDVRDWLGLVDEGGDFSSGKLTELNDRGNNFLEIADIIESEPEGLFVKG